MSMISRIIRRVKRNLLRKAENEAVDAVQDRLTKTAKGVVNKCPECGGEIVHICPECGRESPLDEKYCSHCGTSWKHNKFVSDF